MTTAPITATVIYVTASQIALSAALIMGSVALITLLYRVCSKPTIGSTAAGARCANGIVPNRCRNHQSQSMTSTDNSSSGAVADNHLQTAFQRLSQRLSMTSMQARILWRLRDQPPKYESHMSVDPAANNSSPAANVTAEPAGPFILSIDQPPATVASVRQSVATERNVQMGSAPPCYDNDAYSVSDLWRWWRF